MREKSKKPDAVVRASAGDRVGIYRRGGYAFADHARRADAVDGLLRSRALGGSARRYALGYHRGERVQHAKGARTAGATGGGLSRAPAESGGRYAGAHFCVESVIDGEGESCRY